MRIATFLFGVCISTGLWADGPRLVIDSGGHDDTVNGVQFSHDGRFLVSAGLDRVVRIWDVKSGQTIRAIRGQIGEGPDGEQGKIYALALSPDDSLIAVGGLLTGTHAEQSAIRIHNFADGSARSLLLGHQNVVLALAFSPDGKYLASGSADNTVCVWTVSNMTKRGCLSGHHDWVVSVAWSPDGGSLVSASKDRTMRLWDFRNGKPSQEMSGHQDAVGSAEFTPDGRYIVSSSEDQSVRLWDGRSGAFIKMLQKQGVKGSKLTVAPSGNRVLTCSVYGPSPVCEVLAIASGERVGRFEGHHTTVLSTAISRDGATAATAGLAEILLWNIASPGAGKALAGKVEDVAHVGFARDGNSIAFGKDGLTTAMRLQEGEDFALSLAGAAPSPMNYIAEINTFRDYQLRPADGKSTLQILKAGKLQQQIVRDATSGYFHTAYTFTPDGRAVISGGVGGRLQIYDLQGTSRKSLVGHTGLIRSLAASPDSQVLVSCSEDHTVRLWDINAGHPTFGQNFLTIFMGSDREWVAWVPQGYYVSSRYGDRYIGWHVNQGNDKAAKYYRAAQFQADFYRPMVIAAQLKTHDILAAVREVNATLKTNEPLKGPELVVSIEPPQVVITAPADDGAVLTDDKPRIKATIISTTLPITEVAISINTTPLARIRSDGITWKGADHKRGEIDVEIPREALRRGDNTIRVLARNAKSDSKPEIRSIVYEVTPPKPRPSLIILAVGVSKYQQKELNLRFASADAVAVGKAFQSQANTELFNKVTVQTLVDEQATKPNIIKALLALNKNATAADLRVLFLSGHGHLAYNNYYFCPTEHGPEEEDAPIKDVKWSDMLDLLTNAPGKAIIMVDTCHAAAILGHKGIRENDLNDLLKQYTQQLEGYVFYMAGASNENAVEKPEWGHGAFTKVLLDGLGGAASTDHKSITTLQLRTYLENGIQDLKVGQHTIYYQRPEDLLPFPLFVVPKNRAN